MNGTVDVELSNVSLADSELTVGTHRLTHHRLFLEDLAHERNVITHVGVSETIVVSCQLSKWVGLLKKIAKAQGIEIH